LQAGAMGLPSIVTNINGCNEIIEHNVNGLIIPVKNVNAIIESMEFMHNNSTERNKMASKAREIIASHYQHTYIWSKLLEVYQLTENQNVIS
jgi:glycosyltransferase involved in cell wall biosynthesis